MDCDNLFKEWYMCVVMNPTWQIPKCEGLYEKWRSCKKIKANGIKFSWPSLVPKEFVNKDPK